MHYFCSAFLLSFTIKMVTKRALFLVKSSNFLKMSFEISELLKFLSIDLCSTLQSPTKNLKEVQDVVLRNKKNIEAIYMPFLFFILYHGWDVLLSNFLKTSYICIENNPYALSKLGIEAEHVCKTLWNWKSINSSKSNTFLLLTSWSHHDDVFGNIILS